MLHPLTNAGNSFVTKNMREIIIMQKFVILHVDLMARKAPLSSVIFWSHTFLWVDLIELSF